MAPGHAWLVVGVAQVCQHPAVRGLGQHRVIFVDHNKPELRGSTEVVGITAAHNSPTREQGVERRGITAAPYTHTKLRHTDIPCL